MGQLHLQALLAMLCKSVFHMALMLMCPIQAAVPLQ